MKRSTGRRLVPIRVIGELLFLYGLLGWAYGVVIQVTYPSWLPIPMSHWTRWLRVDDYTIASFIVSAVGFGLWRLTREVADIPLQ